MVTNTTDPTEIREQHPKQWKQAKSTRDCPECTGHMDRTDVWMHDSVLMERYVHKGAPDCEHADTGGFLGDRHLAMHHPGGRSKGDGALKGEL